MTQQILDAVPQRRRRRRAARARPFHVEVDDAVLELSDQQARQLSQVAATVPHHWRESFEHDVLDKLDGYYQPSNTVVQKAIDAALSGLGVHTTSVSLCDAAPTKEGPMAPRTYQRHDLDDNDAYDENGSLKDGHALVVPLRMMDAMQKDVHEHFSSAKVTDGAGDSGLSLHRPGFRISNTITRDRSIYDAYDAEMASAYKNVGARDREALDQCVDRQGDAASVTDDRSAAYQEYEHRIQNAWRNP